MQPDEASTDGVEVPDRQPIYTPQQIGAMLLDFYRFLITLHYKPEDLKVPPPDGWPELTPERCQHFRGDFALQVIRYLPYFTTTRARMSTRSARCSTTQRASRGTSCRDARTGTGRSGGPRRAGCRRAGCCPELNRDSADISS